MENSSPVENSVFQVEFWINSYETISAWFWTTFATQDAILELGIIALAAALAWPIARALRKRIDQLGQRHARYAILKRFWLTLGKVIFPLVWLAIQWLATLLLVQVDLKDGLLIITSSLLSAWVVINIVTVFVVNPLTSRIIAWTAWAVAALNIVGGLEGTLTFLDGLAFNLGDSTVSALTIIKGVIVLAGLLWGTALAGQIIEGRIKASPNLSPSMQVLSAKLMRIVFAIFAFVFVLSLIGIDLTAFAVVGGAVGVGIGFGLQKIFANLISGFILLVDKSIKPGDVIVVGTNYGKVNSLGARYVSVLTRDGIEHLIPNEELIITRVENWSHSNELIRLRKMVGVHYKSDLNRVLELCYQALSETPRILKDPAPKCLIQEFADSSVNIEMRFWISDPMNGCSNVSSDLLHNIWDKFHENDIEIPYPQRDVHFRSPMPT